MSESLIGKKVRRYIESSDVFQYAEIVKVFTTTGEYLVKVPDCRICQLWSIDECEIVN
jgi:hypothetical protein